MKICNEIECTGCYACYNICPNMCIEFEPDEMGFMIPRIDKDRCINCGLCQKICPNNNPVSHNTPSTAYACWSLDSSDRQTSSSGGAASVFSSYIINNGGIVYGAAVEPGGRVCHIRVDNQKDLNRLKGSKYVQSFTGDILKDVRLDLENHKKVLYIGTPCQIAGLKSYLRKEYEGLVTIDLICHGVPSQQLLNDHIIDCVGNLEVDNVTFRSDDNFYLKLWKNNKEKYCKIIFRDLYLTGFTKGLFYRDSCYICSYASEKRVSDITIGDFWGLGKSRAFNHKTKGGVSVLLPVSSKGLNLIHLCGDMLFLEEREVSEAVAGNAQLNRPTYKNKNAEKFKTIYKQLGFEKAAKKSLRLQRLKYFILAMVYKINGEI